MKIRSLGLILVGCALFLSGGATSSEPPAYVSSRVERAVAALTQAQETGELRGLPSYIKSSIRNLPADGGVFPGAGQADPELSLLIRTSDGAAELRRSGFEVGTVAGDVATVYAPVSRVNELRTLSGVRRVDIALPLKPLLDQSIAETNLLAAHGGSAPPYSGDTGAGVVVGIIDTGIDYKHEDFKNADGTNRITRIWDQTDGVGPKPSGYNYGSEFTSTTINAESARERDNDGHGTHVAGIAVGNGRANASPGQPYTFVGAAPEAEIYFVKTNFLESGIIDGVNWIQSRATAAGKASVVNLSLGSQFGPHDGTSNLDEALEALVGPGKLIVAAAGNEGNADLHAEASVAGSSGNAGIQLHIGNFTPFPGTDNDILYIDGWFPGTANFQISVTSPNGFTVGPVGAGQVAQQSTTDGTVRIEQGNGSNGDRNVLIDLFDPDGVAPRSGNWTVQVVNVGSTAQEIDLWITWNQVGQNYTSIYWNNFLDPGEMIASPASSDKIIAVGAYVTKVTWPKFNGGTCDYVNPPPVGQIASFSSPGPRRDGFQKPEVSAPGMGIASARSSTAGNSIFIDSCARTPDGLHTVAQGTSQASPHVTGLVALMLGRDPVGTYADIVNRLKTTARHDIYTGGGYSPAFGFGKIDAMAALDTYVPVRLLSIVAGWEGAEAVIRWELTETEPGARFQVERGASESGPYSAVSEPLEGGLSFSWKDPDPRSEEPWYRVTATDRTGNIDRFGPVRLEPLAGDLRLWQNAPNPFAASTVISFELDRSREVTVDVIDVSGRRVARLTDGLLPAGRNEVTWNGQEDGGRQAAAGVYFYRLVTKDSVLAGRMLLTR